MAVFHYEGEWVARVYLPRRKTPVYVKLTEHIAAFSRDAGAKVMHDQAIHIGALQLYQKRLVGERDQLREHKATLKLQLSRAEQRVRALECAIRCVLDPDETSQAERWVQEALRFGLTHQHAHARWAHPWWSPVRWFGCSRCVPWSFIAPYSMLTGADRELRRRIFDAVQKTTRDVLLPALRGDAPKDGV